MPFIPMGYGHFSLIFSLSGDPEPIMMTFGGKVNPDEFSDYSGICDQLMQTYADNIKAHICNVYTLTRVDGAFGPAPSSIVASSTLAPIAMGKAQNPIPQNTAVLVRKNTLSGGRRNKGRFYQPGIDRQAVSGTGVFAAGDAAALATDFNDWRVAMALLAPLWEGFYVLHNDEALPPTRIENFGVDTKIATQRRRLR